MAISYEENLPTTWLPSFHGKILHFKTKLRLDVVVKRSDGTKSKLSTSTVWRTIDIAPSLVPKEMLDHSDYQTDAKDLIMMLLEKEGSGAALKRTNPFITHNPEDHERNVVRANFETADKFITDVKGFIPVSYTHLTLPTICSV